MTKANLPVILRANLPQSAIRYKKIEYWGYIIMLAAIIALSFSPLLSIKFPNWSIVLHAMIGTAIVSGVMASAASIAKQKLCKNIWLISDKVADLGALIEALELTSHEPLWFQITARWQLIKMLPTVSQSDAIYLNTSHRQRLNRVLAGNDGGLILAVLAGLEKIGDQTALPYVRVLAEGKGNFNRVKKNDKSKLTNHMSVEAIAQRCLVSIERNVEQKSNLQILLRPSRAATSPDELLRPAAQTDYTTSEQSEQLLRSADV